MIPAQGMKTTPILVPLALLTLALIWLGTQHRTLTELEAQISSFETRLAKSNPATSSQPRLRDIKTALDGQPINWSLVAQELAHNPGGDGIFKANRRIVEHLASLTADELIPALIAADGLPQRERHILEYHLLPLLSEKDPGYLMQQALDDDTKRTRWLDYLPSALTNWTKTSPTDALTWFDTLPENSPFENQLPDFRTSIFNGLLIADAPLAQDPFRTLSDEQKLSYPHHFNFGNDWKAAETKDQNIAKRFADLCRLAPPSSSLSILAPLLSLGESDRSSGLAAIQVNLIAWNTGVSGKLPIASFTHYLQQIEATPTEVSLALDTLIQYDELDLSGQPARTSEELRTWLESQIQRPGKQ